ncbi:MAG: hypothetical protein KIA57_02250 [Enterobacter cloacae]|nr:hypothetical protein [Enterobacter cloacae]
MGTNGLLAVFAIILAWYTLLTDEKRTDFKLRITYLYSAFICSLLLIIMIIVYSPILINILPVNPIPWYFGFTEDTMAFTCLCLIVIFFGAKLLGKTIPKANYKKWVHYSEKYLRAKKFEQLGFLLDKYHEQLFKVLNNKAWSVRLRNKLYPNRFLRLKAKKTNSFLDNPGIMKIRKYLASLLPKNDKEQELIQLNISRLLKSKAFLVYLSDTYPHIAMKATSLHLRDHEEYVTSYFTHLISLPSSDLYRELRDNQNRSHTGEYFLDESNPLLNYYFDDMNVAIKVKIWKPIGDYLEVFIKEQKGKNNYYNKHDIHFSSNDERWNCPIFVGVFFFDVMVTLSIFKRSKYHMWLMYYKYFLTAILENRECHEDVDQNKEFPVRFDYLIYQIISNCSKWVGAIEYLDYTNWSQDNIKISPEHFASKCLGEMMHLIITSSKIEMQQKSYLLEIVIRVMHNLDQRRHNYFSKCIFDNIIRSYEGSPVNEATIVMLREVYSDVDHVIKHENSTFERELSKL